MPSLPAPDGILLVDKPMGMTSHTAVARARRALGTRKVGHAGTLDPMATGLLVLGVGPSTRLLTYFVGLDKTYTATIALGAATTTDDAEGEIIARADASRLTAAALSAGMAALTGAIEQRPSAVSAIKVDGERAYARVRAGESVELAARPVTVSRFELLAFRPSSGAEHADVAAPAEAAAAHSSDAAFATADVVVECSSGTYVRALARDLGAALGVGGHLTALRRTRVGPFVVDGAPMADELGEHAAARLLGPRDAAARVLPVLELDDARAADLEHGRKQASPPGASGLLAATHRGRLVGIARADGGRLVPVTNFPMPPRSSEELP